MVYTHVKSFTIVKNRKCGQVTSHCRKAPLQRADLSLFLNVPVVTVKSEITVWGRLFQTVGEAWAAWQKARFKKSLVANENWFDLVYVYGGTHFFWRTSPRCPVQQDGVNTWTSETTDYTFFETAYQVRRASFRLCWSSWVEAPARVKDKKVATQNIFFCYSLKL